MNMGDICTILLTILIVAHTSTVIKAETNLSNIFLLCKRKDPDLNNCLKTAVQKALKDLKGGSSELELLPLDPLLVTSINIEDGAGRPVKINFNLNNAKLRGLSDAQIQSVRCDLDKRYMEIEAHVPITTIEADYVMNGNFLVLPLTGSGKCNMTLTEYDATVKVRSESLEKQGKTHWDVKEFDLHVGKMKRFQVHFDNLFGGDKALGDNTNKVLNENWESFFEELRPTLHNTFGAVFLMISNIIFHKIPENELFLES